MNDNEFEEWVNKERIKVEIYLKKEGIEKPNVGPWPAFDVAPYFAIWAVESNKEAGKIGLVGVFRRLPNRLCIRRRKM